MGETWTKKNLAVSEVPSDKSLDKTFSYKKTTSLKEGMQKDLQDPTRLDTGKLVFMTLPSERDQKRKQWKILTIAMWWWWLGLMSTCLAFLSEKQSQITVWTE